MDINTLIANENDVAGVVAELNQIKSALTVAAHDYAKAALGAADAAFKEAQAAAPCASVLSHYAEYKLLHQKAHMAMASAHIATGILLRSEETGDDRIDKINAACKIATFEPHVVFAMLEGAHNRIVLTNAMLPEKLSAGALCNPNKVKKVVPKDQDSPPEPPKEEQ